MSRCSSSPGGYYHVHISDPGKNVNLDRADSGNLWQVAAQCLSAPIPEARTCDGALWCTKQGGANRIRRIALSASIREFAIPYTDGSRPWGIVAGLDPALWFAEAWEPIRGASPCPASSPILV